MKKTLLRALPMLFVGLLFALQSMYAQTNYYVDATSGNDVNDGSQANPKKTIQAAINAATSGDIINIANGVYSPTGVVSGQFVNVNKPLTIKGASMIGTIIDGTNANYISAASFGFRITANGVSLQDITVTNFESGVGSTISISNIALTRVAANENYRYGFYSSGTINGLAIKDSKFNNNGNKGGTPVASSARGIMLQSTAADYINIEIDNNEVSNNQLVGVDFAGSNLTNGIKVTNNIINGNGDSGIGLWLGKNNLSSGAVLVSGNTITLTNNARFGIEVKNVLGSGAETGIGSVAVKTNIISQVGTPTNSRDFAAIAVLRRKDGYTDINDQPFGVYISGNTISNIKGSAAAEGDGYGIVLGGTGHTVLSNSISNTEIAVQLQKGNIDYNANTNSPSISNEANTFYFDRDNSADACALIGNNNTLTGNGINYRYVTGASTSTSVAPDMVAKNNTTLVQFCSIQSAINAPSTVSGDVVDVFAGTHTLTTGLVVNKSIALVGNDGILNNKPIITGGDVANKALIYVSAPNVTISNLNLRFQESNFNNATTTTTAGYAIKSGATGTFNNLTITDNLIQGTNATYVFNSAAIFLGVLNTNGNDKVTILRNTVSHTVSGNALGRAVRAFNINGNIDNNNFTAHYATIQAGDPSGGALIVDNNTLQGKLAMNGYVNAGNKITNNTITSGGLADAAGQNGADRQPALIEVISTTVPAATVEVSGNTLNDFKMLGVGVFYSNNVSVINNTLNPLSGSSGTIGLYFDTKTTNSGTPGAKSFENLIVKQNKFNAPASPGTGNIGIKFANSYSSPSLSPLSGAVIGGAGVDANTFDAALNEYIHLDNRVAANTTGDPIWGSPYYNSAAITDIRPFSANVIAEMNVYGAIDTRTDRAAASLLSVKTKIYDKDDAVGLGEVILNFKVRNINTAEGFATIQEAIDDTDTQNSHVINVEEGTYTLTDAVKITKGITLQGNNNNLAVKPIINGTGNVTNKSLFEIDAPNVTVKNFEFQIAQDLNALIGISSTTTDNFNNLTIADNVFKGMKAFNTGLMWTSFAIKLGRGSVGVMGGVPNNLVNVVRNSITYNNLVAPEFFGRGIYAFNTYGKIGGSGADKNIILAAYALQGGELGGGASNDFEFSYNEVPLGIVSAVGAEPGNHKINNNTIGSGIANLTQANNIVRLLEIKGNRTANANIEVANNLIQNYANIGIFIQRSDDVTIKNNTLTPITGANTFSSIVFSTKEGTSGSQSPVTLENLNIVGNTFNGTGGIGVSFLNHNAGASIKPLINAKIGGSDANKNTFAATIGAYVALDATASGTTAAMATLYDVAQTGTNTTDILPFNGDVDASYNVFGATNTGTETNFDNLLAVKAKIADGIDNPLTGYVSIQPQKAFIGALAVLDNALSVVPDGFTLALKNDAAVYGALGNRTVTKSHTFAIDNYTTGEITFNNLTLNALSKEVTFSQAANVTGNFLLTEGKVNATGGLTLNGANTITFDPNKPVNFINGKLKVLNYASGIIGVLIGKGNVSTAVVLSEPTAVSDYELEYFPTAYANTTSFNPAVLGLIHNKEYWTINKLSGSSQAKIALATYDFLNSGFTSFASGDATVARFDSGSSTWVDAGNTANTVNANLGFLVSAANTDFGVFTFAKTPIAVLPITLTSFTAQATIGGALVKWSTAREENNAKFEIEKSFDGKNFFVIDSRNGQGNATVASNYEFLDLNFKQSAYYRLVDVSASGTRKTHTEFTKFVKGLDNSLSVIAYPNPVTTKLYVTVGSVSKENVKLLLTDLTGKTLKVKTADSTQPIELDVAGIATGSYVLQVIKDSGNVSKKIVKL